MKRRRLLKSLGGLSVGTIPLSAQVAGQTDPKPKIQSSFTSPRQTPRSIASVNDKLWLGFKGHNPESIYIVTKDGITDTVLEVNGTFGKNNTIEALTAANGTVYAGGTNINAGRPVYYKLNTDGTTVETLSTPTDFLTASFAHDGSYLWANVNTEKGQLQQLSSAGNIRQSIQIPKSEVQELIWGLTHDGTSFWAAHHGGIINADMDGKIISQFSYPRGSFNGSRGLGLAHDGTSLWLVRGDTNEVLELDTNIDTETPSSDGSDDSGSSTQGSDGNGNQDSQDATTQEPSNPQSGTTNVDSDNDGVPDSEDYAPRDPQVQDKSDLEEDAPSVFGPGFGLFSAFAALGGASGYLLKNRKTDE